MIELKLGDPPPSSAGAVIVRQLPGGLGQVCFMNRQGPVVVYSSQIGRGDDFQQAVRWALDWAAHRRIERIYVEAGPARAASEAAWSAA
ncbi:MAG: hypothetical protein JO127_15080 [Caulobacteraceae bacterium]|nr:hypothetical protein [Caulobacteraceae bacterium]